MRKLWLSMLCALALLGTATVSDAKIFVNISDGTTTLDALTPPPPFTKVGLVLSKASGAPQGTTDVTDTLNILTCPTRPCTVGFPSGVINGLATDTFKIQDISTTNLARIEKLDSGTSSDRISFKGVKFTATALGAGKVLTVTYGTQTGDLRALTTTQASSYFVSAAFSGSFKTSTGLKAAACKAGTVATDMDTADEACVRLSTVLNGTTVDGQGSSVSTTIAVACNNAFPTVNPCGTGGSWTAATGTFTGVNDGRSLSCPSTCSPAQVSTLTARFSAANEVLQLTASLNGVISNVTDENGGVEDAAIALADEVPLNRWISTSGTLERCKAVPKAPTTNDTRNIVNNANLPISFEYWCGQFSPAGPAGVPVVSLGDTPLLPGAVGARYAASRVTFVPTPGSLLFKDVNSVSFNYDVAVGTEATPTEPRLGTLTYADCRDGSLRIEIQLVDSSGVDKGTVKVYLGSTTADFFKNGCDSVATTVGADIVGNPDARVDLSGLAGNLSSPCCVKFSSANKGNVGNLRVRRIAFIVSRPVSPPSDPAENYKVTLFDASVNGISAGSSLQVITNFVRVTDLSTNGVSIVIQKLTGQNTGVVKVVSGSDIIINGGKFTTSVNVNDIQAESQQSYAISLCPNGTTDNDPNLPANTVIGNCVADNAQFSFQ